MSVSIINIVNRDISYFELLLKERTPFALARYGDGEFLSILGYSGKNCDGVPYTPELRYALSETLLYPHLQENYHYGMLAVALRFLRPHIEKFIRANNLDITWAEATFLVAANRQGKLAEFLKTLRSRRMIYVGPKYLRNIDKIVNLRIKAFVTIPEKTAFEERYAIIDRILTVSDRADVIGFSAGPATKWLIWQLFTEIGESHTLFDFGSIFDGYVGRPSRKYQRRSNWPSLIASNLS